MMMGDGVVAAVRKLLLTGDIGFSTVVAVGATWMTTTDAGS